MSSLRFNHVFLFLMFLSALCAWFSPHVSARVQGQLQVLFIPVARPFYALGGWAHDRVSSAHARDLDSPDQPRTTDELRRQNEDLQEQLTSLTGELNKLKELDADRSKIGDLRSRCTPVQVAGGDSALHDSLLLSGGTMQGLRENMPVICPEGIVGRLTSVGIDAARVQLITDKGVMVFVRFVRFAPGKDGVTRRVEVSYPDQIAIGQGGGEMLIKNQKWADLSQYVKANDIVEIDDKEWPLHYRIGRVTGIEQQKGVAGFGQVDIESSVDVLGLREVMVLTK